MTKPILTDMQVIETSINAISQWLHNEESETQIAGDEFSQIEAILIRAKEAIKSLNIDYGDDIVNKLDNLAKSHNMSISSINTTKEIRELIKEKSGEFNVRFTWYHMQKLE